MMKFEPHYSGIETAELRRFGMCLYASRTTRTHTLDFVRFSYARPWRRKRSGWGMIGLFIGRTNYIESINGGFEVFTRRMHFGYTPHPRTKRIRWSGSYVRPYTAVTIMLGRIGFGMQVPKFIEEWKTRREDAKWQKVFADMDDNGQENV